MVTDQAWPSDWLRAVLGLCVLRAIQAGDDYGYAIVQALGRAGLGVVKGGTLYPLLSRQEAAGLLDAHWRPGDGGPGRKHYRLTAAGTAELDADAARWRRFADLTLAHLDAGHGTDNGTGHGTDRAPAPVPRPEQPTEARR